jgi:integrase
VTKHNPSNERIKRQYFTYLKEAKRQSEASVDAAAEAIARFEADTQYRDFKAFRIEQAVVFKRRLAEQTVRRTGMPVSKATSYTVLGHLKRFFVWLAGQPGYRSAIRYSDADYFNPSDKDARVATARRQRPYPTVEQVKHAIANMPATSDIERRDRAIVAFTLLTGARDSAIVSLKLKHVDVVTGLVDQDARDVNTKNSKSFETFFFPVGEDVRQIVVDWMTHLRECKFWGNDDPLFPATHVVLGSDAHRFEAKGIKREHWRTATPIRAIFKTAFAAAGLPYFNPHSFRKTLVALGETCCKTPEQFKAWSQNLGHEGVLTTFYSYGAVQVSRQQEIIRSLATPPACDVPLSVEAIADAVARRFSRLTTAPEAPASPPADPS